MYVTASTNQHTSNAVARKSMKNYALQLWQRIKSNGYYTAMLLGYTCATDFPDRILRRILCNESQNKDQYQFKNALANKYSPNKQSIWSLNDSLLACILFNLEQKEWVGLNECHSLLNIAKKEYSYLLPEQWLYQKHLRSGRTACESIMHISEYTGNKAIAQRILFDGTILSEADYRILNEIIDFMGGDHEILVQSPELPLKSPNNKLTKNNQSSKPELSTKVLPVTLVSHRPLVRWWPGLICNVTSFLSLLGIIYFARCCKFMYFNIFTYFCIRQCPVLYYEIFTKLQAKLWLQFHKQYGPFTDITLHRYLFSGISHLIYDPDFATEYLFDLPRWRADNIIVFTGSFWKLKQIQAPLKIVEYIYKSNCYYNETPDHNGWDSFNNSLYIVPLFIVTHLIGNAYPHSLRCHILTFNKCECYCSVLFVSVANNNDIKYYYWNECSFTWSDEPSDTYGSSLVSAPELDTKRSGDKEIYFINVWHYTGMMALLSLNKVFYKCFTKFYWKLMGRHINDEFCVAGDVLAEIPKWASVKEITIVIEYHSSFDWTEKPITSDPNDPHAWNCVDWLWDWVKNAWPTISHNTQIKSFRLICSSLSDQENTVDSGFGIDLKRIVTQEQLFFFQVKWTRMVIRFDETDIQAPKIVRKYWSLFKAPIQSVLSK